MKNEFSCNSQLVGVIFDSMFKSIISIEKATEGVDRSSGAAVLQGDTQQCKAKSIYARLGEFTLERDSPLKKNEVLCGIEARVFPIGRNPWVTARLSTNTVIAKTGQFGFAANMTASDLTRFQSLIPEILQRMEEVRAELRADYEKFEKPFETPALFASMSNRKRKSESPIPQSSESSAPSPHESREEYLKRMAQQFDKQQSSSSS